MKGSAVYVVESRLKGSLRWAPRFVGLFPSRAEARWWITGQPQGRLIGRFFRVARYERVRPAV